MGDLVQLDTLRQGRPVPVAPLTPGMNPNEKIRASQDQWLVDQVLEWEWLRHTASPWSRKTGLLPCACWRSCGRSRGDDAGTAVPRRSAEADGQHQWE
jgi:hypothetical protein